MVVVDDQTLSGFVDVDDAAMLVADRSTLERYATCPAQANIIASGRINDSSPEADSGSEVHKAFSEALSLYIDSRGQLSPNELRSEVEQHLYGSRPDIQPDVVKAGIRAIYDWSKLIYTTHWQNIERYDGGQGEKSGQLAWDIEGLRVRTTSELDLLYGGASRNVLHEIDYKSGQKFYRVTDIRDSFQFTHHAVLVFHNYPEVELLEVRVWNTRSNHLTYPVEFIRDRLRQYEARVRSAAGYFAQYHGAESAPAWPSAYQCSICSAAILCPVASEPIREIQSDPREFVSRILAVETTLKEMKSLASKYTAANGDIVTDDGIAFGYDKPKSSRRSPAVLYEIKNSDESEEV